MKKRHKSFPVKPCKKKQNQRENLLDSFLAKRGFLENKDITVIEGKKIKISKKDLSKTFNEHYINIVKEAVE